MPSYPDQWTPAKIDKDYHAPELIEDVEGVLFEFTFDLTIPPPSVRHSTNRVLWYFIQDIIRVSSYS